MLKSIPPANSSKDQQNLLVIFIKRSIFFYTMKEEVSVWWEQAKSDLNAAKNSLKSRNFDWACFQAQQAAEKGLKAFYIQEFNTFKKIHDLSFFAKELKAPDKILELCFRLSPVYAETRYPDGSGKIPARRFSEEDTQKNIKHAEVILEWLEKELSPS